MTARISARRVGVEQQPIAIVDGFHPDPDALRDVAVTARFEPGRHHYPGLRAPLPADYFARVRPALTLVLREVFGAGGGIALIDASFAIVTTSADALTIPQRIPHVDALDADRIALVHYLSPAGGDGTAFFRHRSTGFETIDASRGPHYSERLAREIAATPPAQAYIAGDTPLFERIDGVSGDYNRAVVYRSAMLHSGAIAPDTLLSADPAHGRLTVTAFLQLGTS
ncbi:hypothetical protein D9601_09530 [Sphingomonas sp. MA1305]|uniref:DUF6445 family protein n=1 Tax=Sphingomonas sp. MA1305 TaxID=2479204 RepID=UPI0018DF91AE|nr:DUF6445 family protein [Sphingomonas sp. MA1305]MBI0475591.1 hypothetical protein [Sphingomonas sp. MA1305]